MDKLYKTHFLSQLKARMPLDRPDFTLRKVAKDDPLRWLFVGGPLFVHALASGRCVWLAWSPGEGVERAFFVHLGWSFSPSILPSNQPGDTRIHFVHGPSPGLPAGLINVQSVERRQCVAGYTIATPWDQLYALSPRVAEDERKRVMDKAYAEYLAVPESERIQAVRAALDQAFASIAAVLAEFIAALEALPDGNA